jgi:hypothetical protein
MALSCRRKAAGRATPGAAVKVLVMKGMVRTAAGGQARKREICSSVRR